MKYWPILRPDMLDANKKREMMEEIVKNIMARMKEQGMSDKEILKTIEKISKQEKKINLQKDTPP